MNRNTINSMNRNTISIRISQQNETERIGILLCGVCDIVLESAPTVWIGILLVLVSANKTNRNRNTISISISQQNETERIGILLVLESAPTVWIGILLVLANGDGIWEVVKFLGGGDASVILTKKGKSEVFLDWEPLFVQNRNLSD